MPDQLALPKLYADVVAQFAVTAPSVSQPFGWRTPPRQWQGACIAWVPGDTAGILGSDSPARNPGRVPRSIATLQELFHCVISTSDPTDPENELAQYIAVRLLRDAWQVAVYRSAHGTFRIVQQQWNIDRQNERRFGATIIATCALESAVWSDALEVGVPVYDASIIAPLSLLDHTDTITVTNPGPTPAPKDLP
jgi:hypothetical protein